jgi:hypothetical protein
MVPFDHIAGGGVHFPVNICFGTQMQKYQFANSVGFYVPYQEKVNFYLER